jgi:metal-sulfur cluster biosynthetic enzyme
VVSQGSKPCAPRARDATTSPFAPTFSTPSGKRTDTPDDRLATARAALEAVPDPEIPVVSIRDLGILRDVRLGDDGLTLEAVITPTYSGCPAMSQIEEDVGRALEAAGSRPGASARTGARLDHRLDHRIRPRQPARLRHRPAGALRHGCPAG